MKHKDCLVLIPCILILFQHVKAPEVVKGAQLQEGETSNVDNVVESQAEMPNAEIVNAESQIKLPVDENFANLQGETSNVENIADSHQLETPEVEKVAESQAKSSTAENVPELETPIENIAESQVETSKVENSVKLEVPDVEDVALLQSYIEPILYRVFIYISNKGEKPSFTGMVKTRIKCLVETDKVALNAKNMEITEFQAGVSVIPSKAHVPKDIVKTRRMYFARNRPDIFVIELKESLKKGGIYEVGSIVTSDEYLEHTEIRKQIMYKYTNDWDNHEMLEVIAKIGPNKASLLFPCFHEINVKSRILFEITHYAENVIALSNWPVAKEKNFIGTFRDQVTYTFEKTGPIPASGLSFAVVSYKSTDLFDPPTDTEETPVRIWADERLIRFMIEARKVATKALKFYSEYFSAPIYATKLDILAVPKFQEGDTEKFGLISLEESSLVYYGADDQKYFEITCYLCFAMTGQWIGTSVTLSNLNEHYFHHALSHFLEPLCVNEVNPNKGLDYYNLRNLITFNRTLMPEYETRLYSEFDSVFNHKLPTGDTQKALHLVQMLVFILNEETLHESLMVYLKRFEHSFSSLDNLWEILTTVAAEAKILNDDMTVKEILNTWIQEPKFPLVRVNVDYSQQMITLSQEPFKFLGEAKEDVKEVCWNISLGFIFKTSWKVLHGNVSLPDWLTCGESITFKVDLNSDEWIIVNSQLNVLSHTYLDDKNWELIQKTLMNPKTFTDIDALTRAHLLMDMFALAEARVVPYDRVFHTLKYLRHEISELCWIVALTEFDKINFYLLGSTELLEQFQNYVGDILDPVFDSVSIDEKIEVLPQYDDLKGKPFDEPENTAKTDQGHDIKAESTKFVQSAKMDQIPTNELLKEDKKFRKLFDEPVKLDKIRQNDKLKMEFQKLFIRASCKFKVTGCLNQSRGLYDRWIQSIKNKDPVKKEIPIEVRDTVLCYIMQSSSKKVWRRERSRLVKVKESKENDIILKALGCSEIEKKLKKYLKKTLKKTYQGNNLKAFASLSSSTIGYSVMKDFLKNKFYKIKKHLELTNTPDREPMKMELYFIELFKITTKKEDVTELLKFMESVKRYVDQSDELVQKSIKKANKNVLWLETHKSTWKRLLNGYKSISE